MLEFDYSAAFTACISYDGQFVAPLDEVWQCPKCFQTIRHCAVRVYEPNLRCACEYPHAVYLMRSLGLFPPVGYRLREQLPKRCDCHVCRFADRTQNQSAPFRPTSFFDLSLYSGLRSSGR